MPLSPEVFSRALEVQRGLAQKGQHRLPIADLIIAAAAEVSRLSVLHYDRDFERISTVTGQPHQWIVPAGSLSH